MHSTRVVVVVVVVVVRDKYKHTRVCTCAREDLTDTRAVKTGL